MKIQLNEKAASYFNEKAKEFLYELKPDTTKKRKYVESESSASHVFVSDHFTDKDIIGITSKGYVDQISGEQVARYFMVDNRPIGLGQEPYAAFVKFAQNFHERKEINEVLSLKFILDCTFRWFEKKYKGHILADNDFVEFVTQEAEEAIKKCKISIPISLLSIEKPFKVGNITFEYFRTDFFNRCIDHIKSYAKESKDFNLDNFGIFDRDFRKKYQGKVFASISLEAEQERCIEVARSATEKALMVLRFFSPSAFLPQVPCLWGIMGQTDIPKNHVFIFESEFPIVNEDIEKRMAHEFSISYRELKEIESHGMGAASDLIRKERPSSFEDLILNSMFLFGRALISNNFQDKIVYLLVSIETLLLQNQSEPIQHNIGLRLSFLTESKPEKRKGVRDLINRAYRIRSSYIHHGKICEEWELLEKLQHSIWTGIRNALVTRDEFETQKGFLNHIEELILA